MQLKHWFWLMSMLLPMFLLNYCTTRQPEKKSKWLNVYGDVQYVGMQKCLQCHSDVHSTFKHTGMGQSWDVASHEKSSGKYWDHAYVYDKNKNFWYHPYWVGDSLYIKQFRLKGTDTIYKRIEKISYIVGSGQHTNSHIWEQNGF